MKFTDEELSRILTAHSLGELQRAGKPGPAYPCCIIQTAKETDVVYEEPSDGYSYQGFEESQKVANWFDVEYQYFWTEEQLIDELNHLGVI